MARFDVYRNATVGARETPYLLDVQAGLLADRHTEVVGALDFLFQGY
jgi:hypothetical protein